ncbi:MAG TPA: hypothetical protein VGM42_15290, partial [Rhodopila sp.]
RPAAVYGFATVCTFLSLWLVMAAIFSYLNVGLKKKTETITGFYTPDTIADYFNQFWAGRDGFRRLVFNYRTDATPGRPITGQALDEQFQALFATDFGVKTYIIPTIILLATGTVVLFMGYAGGLGYAIALGDPAQIVPVQPFGIKLELISIAAIFGAYTWVASDVIVRAHQWTLHPSDLAWYALRLIVAVPLGYALALAVGANPAATGATVPAGIGAFAAFVGSMFSLDAITKALGTAATRFGLPMNSSPEERDDLIIKLAGVDDSKAQALATEGLSTIGQLVTADPIRVSIRTGLSFEYVLNLINSALLWVFVGNALKLLAPLGLRGASDVLALDDAWVRADAAALAVLRQADGDFTAARAASAAAPADAVRTAAAAAAEQARTEALVAFLATVNADASVAPAHAAMIAALAASANDGGPGLKAVGFDTIRARLRESTYAVFVRKLLDQ